MRADEAFEIREVARENGGATFAVVVPADCPYFADHFPGRPILPAVAQLALVEHLLRRLRVPTIGLRAVDDLRLQRQVRPGDALTVRVAVDADSDAARFEMRCGADAVCRGSVRWARGWSR